MSFGELHDVRRHAHWHQLFCYLWHKQHRLTLTGKLGHTTSHSWRINHLFQHLRHNEMKPNAKMQDLMYSASPPEPGSKSSLVSPTVSSSTKILKYALLHLGTGSRLSPHGVVLPEVHHIRTRSVPLSKLRAKTFLLFRLGESGHHTNVGNTRGGTRRLLLLWLMNGGRFGWLVGSSVGRLVWLVWVVGWCGWCCSWLLVFQTHVNEKRCVCRHNHTRAAVTETGLHVARYMGVKLLATSPPPALDDTP